MKVSFVTRFRRYLATIPFVIVLLLPVGFVAIYIAHDGGAAEADVTPVILGSGVEPICLDADTLAEQVGACPEPVQGAE